MSKKLAGKMNDEQKSQRKHETCPSCKLRIRCGDIEKHEAGMHHRLKKK